MLNNLFATGLQCAGYALGAGNPETSFSSLWLHSRIETIQSALKSAPALSKDKLPPRADGHWQPIGSAAAGIVVRLAAMRGA